MTLNADFLSTLEHSIRQALRHLDTDETKGFWCDGILLSEGNAHYSIKSVNANRSVKLKAFLGKDGQTPYELTLLFGGHALSRYARDLSLEDCIPDRPADEWIAVDTAKKQITVHLD